MIFTSLLSHRLLQPVKVIPFWVMLQSSPSHWFLIATHLRTIQPRHCVEAFAWKPSATRRYYTKVALCLAMVVWRRGLPLHSAQICGSMLSGKFPHPIRTVLVMQFETFSYIFLRKKWATKSNSKRFSCTEDFWGFPKMGGTSKSS